MNNIREALRETIYDFLAEDERFYGKMDGTESITAIPEKLINELETYINKVREEAAEKEDGEILFEDKVLGMFEEGCVYDCWKVGRKLFVADRRKIQSIKEQEKGFK